MSWSRSLLALGLLAACGVPDLPDVPGVGPSETTEEAAEEAAAVPRGLWVRIKAVGPNGVVPREIVVRASQPVFDAADVHGTPPEGNAVRITPATEGAWEITATDTLTFTPSAPLIPDADYTVEAVALGSGEPRRAGEDESWTHTFHTPAFGFQRMAMRERDPRAKRVTVETVFTGPVRPEDVTGKVTFRLGDETVRPVYRGEGSEPNTVRFTFAGDAYFQDVPLTVEVEPGVPMHPEPPSGAVVTAMRGNSKVDLSAGKTMEILAVSVKEGSSGFYVDVICNDQAGGPQRWWWDRETWEDYNVSERCELSLEEAQRGIHFDPGVDVTVAPGPVGFRLFGEFERGEYEARFDAGLRTVDGGMLGSSYETQFKIPERSPSIQFAAKGRYLPRSAWDELAVRHVNVDGVELTVRHVPEENLVFWMSGEEPATSRTSNVVLKKRIAVDNVPDDEVTTWLDVGALLPRAGKGVYELKVRGLESLDEPEEAQEVAETQDTGWWHEEQETDDESGPTDFSRLLLTDLQLIAKLAAPGPEQEWAPAAHVFALDTHENRPVGGVDVRIVRPSGQTLGSCRTDLGGACTVELKQDPADDTPPMAVIARKQDDLTYLKFSDVEIAPPADTSGLAFLDEQPYRAAVYTDRGVYRPGDEAHLAAVVRDTARGFLAPSANLPVVAKLFDPRGKEMRKKVLMTNAAGLVAVDWPFGDFATTGKYRSVLEIGGKAVGETSFAVEEFVPERMKVEAYAQGDHLASEAVPVAVQARWLFGGSAGGSEVELACQVVPGAFTPDQNRSYHYGLAAIEDGSARRAITLGTLKGVLDDEGELVLDCPAADRSGGFMGAATLVAQAAVFEGDSGRTTLGEARAPLHPAPFYVGLSGPSAKVDGGEEFAVSGVVVDWEGAKAPGAVDSVRLDLVRLEEDYVYSWDRAERRYRYRRMLRRSQEDSVDVPVNQGAFSTHLTPENDAAGYLVVATAGEARTELHLEGTGRRYWWWGGDSSVDQTPRPQKPGELAMVAPETTRVGDEITVRTTAPYGGRVLFTAETHEVIGYRWLEVEAGPVEWSFTVDEYVPNVYVSALLVKDPHLESDEAYLPDRAFGVRSVRVRPVDFTQALTLDVPGEIQPYSTLEVGIDVGKQEEPTYVTVAAIDEGILSLTDFESPDPLAQIFARRALGVDTYETVGWTLLVPPGGPGRTTGGDGMAAGGRVQMVKPVALWSGVVEVPKSGKARVELEVPGYRGELRVMAVSTTSKTMGHADAQVTVRDPIVLQTTLPRFLVGGDEALLPVFVSNMSGKARDIVVDLSVVDLEMASEKVSTDLGGERPSPVSVVGDRQARLSLADGDSDTVLFKVRADRAPDAARFRVQAMADGLRSIEEIELPIERPEPEVRDTSRVVLTQGANDLSGVFDGWVDGSDRTRIWVTTNPYGQALSHIRAAVRYPYGCIEQTTSSTRPLLYVGTMLDSVDPTLAAEDSVDDMVRHGLARILSMQTSQGGFAYWPGGSVPNEWGTAYATHLLLDAQEAGYAVPQPALDDALDWLGREVDKKAGTTSDDFTTAYAHYVLARAGRARTAQAETLLANLSEGNDRYNYRELSEPRYLLMAAMYLGGDRRYESELRSPDTTDLTNKRRNDWTFWSDLRSRAFQLAIYHDLFGSRGAEGEKLAQVVGNGLATHRSRWYTTQEMAWGLTALGKWVGDGLDDLPEPTLTVGGRTLTPEGRASKGGSDYVWSLSRASSAGSVVLDVPRTGGKSVYAVVSVQGVEQGGSPPASDGLVLQRELLGSDGKPLSTTHALGEPIYVRVSIRNTSGSQVQNVALVDRIPAGWEIENPRLGRGYRPDWLDDSSLWAVDHMNLRDDRVEVFGTLDRGETRYVVYQVRAVTAGSFTHPPVTAEAMYDPRIQARTGPGKVRVVDPWGGS